MSQMYPPLLQNALSCTNSSLISQINSFSIIFKTILWIPYSPVLIQLFKFIRQSNQRFSIGRCSILDSNEVIYITLVCPGSTVRGTPSPAPSTSVCNRFAVSSPLCVHNRLAASSCSSGTDVPRLTRD